MSGLMAACLIGAAASAGAADPSVNNRDEQFVREFLNRSAEVERIAQLVFTQSQDSQVQGLGQKLLLTYTQAGQQVAATANALGVNVDRRMNGSAARAVAKLAGLSGEAFDHAALRELYKCEEAGVRQMSLELNNGSGNIALRQLAALLQVGTEPNLWQTTQLNAQFNGQP